MFRTLISRIGAGVVAAALVLGGSLLGAAPATAAAVKSQISVSKTTFQSGAGWGEGFTVTGVDFSAHREVDLYLMAPDGRNTSSVIWDLTRVVTDENGAFSVNIIPEYGPYDLPGGASASIRTTYSDGTSAGENGVFLAITPFVPHEATTVVDPICLNGVAAQSLGFSVSATGFGQFEEGVVYTVTDAAGTQIGAAKPVDIDETGSAELTLVLESIRDGVSGPSAPVADGVYTVTFAGSVTTAGIVTVGTCDPPVVDPPVVDPPVVDPPVVDPPVVDPPVVDPSVVDAPVSAVPVAPATSMAAPAARQLAKTGSSDAGILIGGSALMLLVGAALMVARRRQNANA